MNSINTYNIHNQHIAFIFICFHFNPTNRQIICDIVAKGDKRTVIVRTATFPKNIRQPVHVYENSRFTAVSEHQTLTNTTYPGTDLTIKFKIATMNFAPNQEV